MLEYVFDVGNEITSSLGQLTRIQWIIILTCVVALGAVCLRGFGSRKHY